MYYLWSLAYIRKQNINKLIIQKYTQLNLIRQQLCQQEIILLVMRKRILGPLKKGQLPLCKFFTDYHSPLREASYKSKLALNPSLMTFCDRLKLTASNYKFIYLTTPQTFSHESIFVIRKQFKNHIWIHQTYTGKDTYKAYINPEIKQKKGEILDVWEKCMSLPYVQFKTKRYQQIVAKYTTQDRQQEQQEYFGFKSIVYQHCIDHLKGKCVQDWSLSQGNFRLYPQLEHQFPKTKFILKDYGMRIRQALSKRPNRIITDENELNQQQKTLKTTQQQILRNALNEELNQLTLKYNKDK